MPAQVGVFWVLPDHRVLIDATPLDQSERYQRFRIHACPYTDTWTRWQEEGKVPVDLDYDSVPRGRVAYDWVTERFSLLADRRILKDQAAMQEIMTCLGLPEDTQVGTDPHYVTQRVEDQDDWDDEEED